MKKLLLYIDCMQLGGANRVMANLANYFSEKNTKVVLVNDVHIAIGMQEYELSDNVRRIFLDDYNRSSSNRFQKNINRIRALRRIVKSENPDIVLSFMGPPNERMLLATLGIGVRKVVSVRNDPYREYGLGLKKILANLLFLTANGCVFQTEEASQYFVSRIIRNSTIILNPVNPKFYEQDRKKENNHIVMIGRLQPQKNPMLMIEAFGKISKQYPEYKLDFFGEGELKPFLENRANELGIRNSVNFMGQVNDVERVLAESSLFVITSDFEGMPNALMEAMAVGVPVIATDCPCGGPRTLIDDGRDGFLFPCGDVESLVNKIRIVLNDKELRTSMGKLAKEKSKVFSPYTIYRKWNDYFEFVSKNN